MSVEADAHYNQIYVDLTSTLLTTLGHIKDYRCIMDYGPRALEIEPGILTAYYWIIIAADETDNSMPGVPFVYETYDVKEGDGMYLAPEDRIVVW